MWSGPKNGVCRAGLPGWELARPKRWRFCSPLLPLRSFRHQRFSQCQNVKEETVSTKYLQKQDYVGHFVTMIAIKIYVIFVTCAVLVSSAATRPRHQQGERQERRLEDSSPSRLYNSGFVEYKSKSAQVGPNNDEDEIDEYVVIETRDNDDKEFDNNKLVDDPYEEVDNHYDDDLEEDDFVRQQVMNKSLPHKGLVPQVKMDMSNEV